MTLQPIIQAAQLLQARKTEEDVASVCEMCSALTALQICKILNLYTPVDEFEQRVPASFIRKVQAKLQERPGQEQQVTNFLLMFFKMINWYLNFFSLALLQIVVLFVFKLCYFLLSLLFSVVWRYFFSCLILDVRYSTEL